MKEIKDIIFEYKQEINQCNDAEIIEDLVVYRIYDIINDNSELRDKFFNYIRYFKESKNHTGPKDESQDFIAGKFNDFLLFCAERRHISGYEKYFGKQNVIPAPCLFSNRVESVLDDPAQMRTETVQNNAILLDVYAKEKLAKIKNFTSVVVRELLETENVEISDKNDRKIIYQYNDYDAPSGKLKIGNFPELSFNKTPAAVIQFFYLNNEAGQSYKDYSDYNKFVAKKDDYRVNADEFNKKIEVINKRVRKNTEGIIKEIITKTRNGKSGANVYKWEG